MSNKEQTVYEYHGHDLRAKIKAVAAEVKGFIQLSKDATIAVGVHRGEMIANATLSYRHLEDATMRIGKSMQAFQGGVSILDKMRDEEASDALPGDTSCEQPCSQPAE